MNKLHFYNMAFLNEKGQCRSLVVKQNVKAITMNSIENGRVALGLNENAVLMATSYLGFMTEQEYFEGVRPPNIGLKWLKCGALCALPFVILAAVVLLR